MGDGKLTRVGRYREGKSNQDGKAGGLISCKEKLGLSFLKGCYILLLVQSIERDWESCWGVTRKCASCFFQNAETPGF